MGFDIPIELFITFLGVSLAMAIIGLIRQPQIPAMIAFAGMFMLAFTASISNVITGYAQPNITNSTITNVATGNTTYTYQQIYTPTTNINATSSGTVAYMTQNTGTSSVPLYAGSGNIASAEHLADSSSVLINKPINQVVLSLNKAGTPTGNFTVGTFDGSSTMINQCASQSANSLTTSQADYTFNCPSVYFLSNDNTQQSRVGILYNAGDISNNVVMRVSSVDAFDGVHSVRSAIGGGGWADTTTSDLHMSLNFKTNPLYMRDSDARTYWINNVVQESPLCIQVDLGSTNIVNGFRITSPDVTKIPSAIKFYSSNDGSTYTFRQAINLAQVADRETYLTTDTFFVRYYQLCVDQYGTANNWQVSELDFVYASANNNNSSQNIENTYSSAQPILFVFDDFVKVIFTLFSAILILAGALMVYRE